MRRPLIKICGLRTQEALDAACTTPDVKAPCARGADFCGFIFEPGSPRYVEPEEAGRLVTHDAHRVGVFVNQSPPLIAEIAKKARLDFLQMHGNYIADDIISARWMAQDLTGHDIGIIRVFWPEAYDSRDKLMAALDRYTAISTYFLLDAGKSGGGSGQSLDVESLIDLDSPLPWLLAGGLTANAGIRAVFTLDANPTFAGLDFNSGLEDIRGHKDPDKIEAVLRAFAYCGAEEDY